MAERFAIYGTGGFAREVVVPLQMYLEKNSKSDSEIVFIDDNVAMQSKQLHGLRVLDYAMALDQDFQFCVAISNTNVRKSLAERLNSDQASLFSIRANTVLTFAQVEIGPGAILCDHVTITVDAEIGAHFHANIYSYVAHDCRIGDYVTFAPRVCCNGNVTIGDGAYIGTGAMLRQGVTIGENAVIGMGAVVVKDVPANTTVVGNPATTMTKS